MDISCAHTNTRECLLSHPGRCNKLSRFHTVRLRNFRSLGKKFSGLLHNDDLDWSDLGLEKEPGSSGANEANKRSPSKSPTEQTIQEEPDNLNESSKVEVIVRKSVSPDSDHSQGLERWTSSSSVGQRGGVVGVGGGGEPARRKSSEMSSSMKSRLEAFERQEEERRKEKARLEELDEHEERFKEKLKTFQKISSQTDLNSVSGNGSGGDTKGFKRDESKKPPPPLSYSQLIEVRETSTP